MEITFWYAGTCSKYLGQGHISRSSCQVQGHRSKKMSVCFVEGGLPSTGRQPRLSKFQYPNIILTISQRIGYLPHIGHNAIRGQ